MREMKPQELTVEGFQKYGSFCSMTAPDGQKLGPAPVEFFRDMIHVPLGTNGAPTCSVTQISPRPMIAEKFEYHSCTGEGFMPIDQDVIIHIAPAGKKDIIPYDKIEVFRVPKGTMVTMYPGVWHAAPFTAGNEVAHVLVILPERTYANDCEVVLFPDEEKIQLVTE